MNEIQQVLELKFSDRRHLPYTLSYYAHCANVTWNEVVPLHATKAFVGVEV
jgi:hypothetical protein